ncbi:hypothetical protein GCM10027445_33660 [Amycolatopsis endophytica]|uniref:TPM domain-containing protein n=1 Tax=Amycolatopsis endophytica TaxID=860233 RepID=A0A853B0J1_9PSEU|nr:hypothetical protein [Amycolatopsis endophytica]NYI88429.1 hypothetical protein [Amycolatopsis endophytica]
MIRFFRGTFGAATVVCLAFVVWALWTGGIFEGAMAREVRTSSVYAADDVELDEAAAERIIGNRRLVVIMDSPGADLSEGCDDVESAVDGNLVLLLSQEDDDYDTYGCALLPGRDDENFGKAVVAEQIIKRGIGEFHDRPLDAIKVIAVNYDLLVRAGTVPDGARELSPPLPRFLIAGASVVAVVLGAVGINLAARRATRLAVRLQDQREAAGDARSKLTAGSAALAQQIIDLDARRAKDKRYRRIIDDYVRLLDDIAEASTEEEYVALAERVDALGRRCLKLT